MRSWEEKDAVRPLVTGSRRSGLRQTVLIIFELKTVHTDLVSSRYHCFGSDMVWDQSPKCQHDVRIEFEDLGNNSWTLYCAAKFNSEKHIDRDIVTLSMLPFSDCFSEPERLASPFELVFALVCFRWWQGQGQGAQCHIERRRNGANGLISRFGQLWPMAPQRCEGCVQAAEQPALPSRQYQ